MVRPAGGADGIGRRSCCLGPSVWAAVLAGLAALLTIAQAAAAEPSAGSPATESTPPSMLEETGSIQDPGIAAGAGGMNRLAGRRAGGYGSEQRAQELYLDGMEKLTAGHREWASRMFEDLIARYPATSAASLARRRLSTLRTHDAVGPTVLPGAPSVARPSLPPAATIPAISRPPVWDDELRRNAPIQAKLREQAGDRVFFAAGSAELGSRARTALAAQAQWLKTWHEFEAAIEGHADEPGSEEANFRLSLQRAEAVRERLVQEGVEAGRLAIVASGRSQPIATCDSVACHAQNRRAVTLVFTTGTRERLGLSAPLRPTALEAPARLPAAGAVQPVDATH